MNRKWIAAAGLFLSQLAYGASGDDYLTALDAKANLAKDTWFSFEALTQEPGKAPRQMLFDVQNQGEKRLVNFEAPGDMKGTRVLVLSRQQMWVYLPAYNKVRRVASHVTQQG
ncbi:MAG: outer membrane lipoprotein-sorting protein, partial [Myxococcota bacterium]